MRSKTLVILAAGIGSRYGGDKQLASVTPEGETIIDFSIYDALTAGIRKIVFVTRKAIVGDIRSEFAPKLEGRAEIAFVCQDEFPAPTRERPWGTGHAVLSASEAVDGNFWVINADDLYGRAAFLALGSSASRNFEMVAYKLGRTLSPNGPVSRGECIVDEEGALLSVVERTGIVRENGRAVCDEPRASLTLDTPVSMNLWAFTPDVFGMLERRFKEFADENRGSESAEFYITAAVNSIVSEREASVRVLHTDEHWAGVTYREDRRIVARHILDLRARGIYPSRLF